MPLSSLDAPEACRTGCVAIRPYEYRDAASLIADFWSTVGAVQRERGVI